MNKATAPDRTDENMFWPIVRPEPEVLLCTRQAARQHAAAAARQRPPNRKTQTKCFSRSAQRTYGNVMRVRHVRRLFQICYVCRQPLSVACHGGVRSVSCTGRYHEAVMPAPSPPRRNRGDESPDGRQCRWQPRVFPKRFQQYAGIKARSGNEVQDRRGSRRQFSPVDRGRWGHFDR